ncbi:MAG: PHP domain-containing protein [Dehalococcoidales bacterium]|jgi:predicted metal-dependent phosphoesterase TrpH|nr:PHP domain-containing protein [Dehalococcoidales bacterium]
MIKADLHVHTRYSPDSNNSLDDIIRQCLKTGINCLAVCDHGTIEGALKLQAIAPFKVIVAEEILTTHGEIMGMFLKETIPSLITPEEAIKRIREQDGLVCIPHPFDRFRSSAFQGINLEAIKGDIDIIEVYNARMLPFQNRKQALEFARKYNYRESAGSDAHSISEIGRTYIEMPDFNDKKSFLAALEQGEINGRSSSPLVHFLSVKNRIVKRFK